MKGRGARTIDKATFQSVTPDAENKTRFVLVDAVGVTEHEYVEPPLNREKSISLKQLLDKAATLNLSEAETATLASRLSALEAQLAPEERTELDGVAGQPLRQVIRSLVDAVDPDTQATHVEAGGDIQELLDKAIEPIAANPELRTRIIELRRAHDRVIDEVSADTLVDAYGVVDADRAKAVVEDWQAYLDEHRAEISAIQIIQESKERRVAFPDIQELADRIARPPHNWTPDLIWNAYVALGANYRGSGGTRTQHSLTDLVSLLRYAVGVDDALVPYADRVQEKYAGWLAQQAQAGVVFSETERWWLDRMVAVIAASAGISADDLDEAPFTERGGVDGALRDLGDAAGDLLESLNQELTA